MIVRISTHLKDGYVVEVTRKVGDQVITQANFVERNPEALHNAVESMTQTLFDAVKITRPARVLSHKPTTGGV